MNSSQIVNLTLSYVGPNQLGAFFVIHKIPFTLAFKYDARGCTNDDLHNIYAYFPNVCIIGVTVTNRVVTENINDYHNEQKIHHLELLLDETCTHILAWYGTNIGFNVRVKTKTYYFNLTHLKSLRIASEWGDNISSLPIHHLLDWLSNCDTIRIIEFGNIYIDDRCAKSISKYINLKKLKINAICIVNDAIKCPNLRSFVYISTMGWSGRHKVSFLECPKLRYLEIASCTITNVYVPNSPNIQTVVLHRCDSFRNIKSMVEYKKLKHVRFTHCMALREIAALQKCVNLRTICIRWCDPSIDTKIFEPRIRILHQ